jgi:peptidoglycan/LPS O-acetylase OafA/YrhL
MPGKVWESPAKDLIGLKLHAQVQTTTSPTAPSKSSHRAGLAASCFCRISLATAAHYLFEIPARRWLRDRTSRREDLPISSLVA